MQNLKVKADSQSNPHLEDAEHIWKMLDELAGSDPNAYKSFIEKTIEEGKHFMKEEKSFKHWKVFKVKLKSGYSTHEFILYNFWSDPSVVSHKNSWDIPVKTSWNPESVTDKLLVLTVFIHPKLVAILEQKKDEELLDELFLFFSQQLQNKLGLLVNSTSYSYCGTKDLPNEVWSCLTQKPNPAKTGLIEYRSEPVKHKHENAKIDIKLPFQVSDSFADNESPESNLLSHYDSKPQKVLIEEINNGKNSSLPEPIFEVHHHEEYVEYSIKLENVNKLPNYDLVLIPGGGLHLKIATFYELNHVHGKTIDEDCVSAKFVRKSRLLKIKLPILQNN